MIIEIGKQYLVTTDLDIIRRTRAGHVPLMDTFAGKYITPTRIAGTDSEGYVRFCIKEDDDSFGWCSDILVFSPEDRMLKKDDREYKDFKVGDLVKIRPLNDLIKYYKHEITVEHRMFNSDRRRVTIFTQPYVVITVEGMVIERDYAFYEGKSAVIKKIKDNGEVILKFFDIKIPRIKFCTEMLEIEKEGFEMTEDVEIPKIEFKEDEVIKEMLDKVDKTKMKKILASALRKKATDLKGVDKLLLQWAEAKKDLYVLLGRNLTVRESINFEKAPEEMYYEINSLKAQFPALTPLLAYMPSSCFTTNCIDDFYIDEDDDDFKHSNIESFKKKGKKTSKFLSEITQNPMVESLKALTDEEKETYLRLKEKVNFTPKFDIELSKILECRKTTGNIAISIDPIDYLLMSFNKSGWDSCYAISYEGKSREFGCYVSGLFSYMCDISTVVAYRHSDELQEFKIGGSKFEAYSKNWRQLIYVDTKNLGFLCSRQYPFKDATISKAVRLLLEKTLSQNVGLEDTWVATTINGNTIDYIEGKIHQVNSSHTYNDIKHYNKVDGEKMMCNKKLNNKEQLRFEIDSNPICPICGERTISYDSIPTCIYCDD